MTASIQPPRFTPVQPGAIARPYFAAAALVGILAGALRSTDPATNAAMAVANADALIKALSNGVDA
jgi:hypothetical protein